MSYLVLARKYRPQTFDEIVGQEHVTKTLTNAISAGRLHHAFLFTGARGVGKTTAARILAKCLSCINAPTATPCNECEACREITSGASVDVQEIDAASNNGVDNIRELRDAIRYAPVRGKKKVYILDEVHMLSSGAWNALLKTLEEPPPHAVFVFATTDPHKLPATILSRVQRYDFKLVPQRRIAEHLTSILEAEKLSFEPAALSLVTRESGGSVRDSLSLLDQVIASSPSGLTEAGTADTLGVADRTLLDKLGAAILAKDAGAALALVDAAFARGQDLAQLAHALLGHLRDMVVVAAVPDASALIDGSPSELESLARVVKAAPAGLPELLFERFAKTAEEVAKSPVPRYVLEVGLVALTRVEPLEPIGALLAKLEALEARVEKGGPSTTSGGSGGGGARSPSGGGGGPRVQAAPVMSAAAAMPTPSVAPSQVAPTNGTPTPSVAPAQVAPADGAPAQVAPAQVTPAMTNALPASAPVVPSPVAAIADVVVASAAIVATTEIAPVTSAPAVAPAPAAPPAPVTPTATAVSSSAPVSAREDISAELASYEEYAPADEHPFAPPVEVAPARPAHGSNGHAHAANGHAHGSNGAAKRGNAPTSFKALVEAVMEHDPFLCDIAQSRLLARDATKLTLGFDSDFGANRLRERLPKLRDAVKKITGEDLAIELIVGAHEAMVEASENLIEVEERMGDEDRETRRREAINHPARKALDARFGGTWKDPVLDDLEK